MFKLKLTAAAIGTVLCASIISYASAALTIPTNATITGTFRSYDDTVAAQYHYNDNYFSASGEQTNDHLRTMSLALAISTYTKQQNNKGGNITDILEKTGFDTDTIQQDDMDTTRTDSIGSVIAGKKIDGRSLVAVAIRGFDYRNEWASNFACGTQGDAQGFSDSAKKIIERIKDFESRNKLHGAKLWITGYSRAGGVTDLTGKYINEHPDEFGITPDDVYAYTFEAPRACTEKTEYKNIHNTYCDMDIVPKLYPQEWELYHAGTEEKLNVEKKQITIRTISISEGFKLKDKDETDDLAEFEDKFVSWLSKKISREDLCGDFKPITDTAVNFISGTPEQQKAAVSYLQAVLSDTAAHFRSSKLALLRAAGIFASGTVKNISVKYLTGVITSAMDDNDHSKAFSDEQYSQLKDAVPTLVNTTVDLFRADLSENDLTYLPTFFSYASQIVKYHYSKEIWDAVISADDLYSAEIPAAA